MTSRNSFVGSLVASRGGDIYFITGNDHTDKKAFYYLRVFKGKRPLLDHALKTGALRLTDFGEIVVSGYGETVPDDIKERMRREFGCD